MTALLQRMWALAADVSRDSVTSSQGVNVGSAFGPPTATYAKGSLKRSSRARHALPNTVKVGHTICWLLSTKALLKSAPSMFAPPKSLLYQPNILMASAT